MSEGFGIRGEVEGLAAIVKTLEELPDKLQRKVVRKALAKATKGTVAAARRLVPVDSGLLKKSLGRKTVTYLDSGTIVVVIGPRKGFQRMVTRRGKQKPGLEDPAKIAHLVEFGTQPHAVNKGYKNRGLGRSAAIDLKIRRGIGRVHPGAKAHPFLRPAFDETKGEIIRIFAAEVAIGLEKELAM